VTRQVGSKPSVCNRCELVLESTQVQDREKAYSWNGKSALSPSPHIIIYLSRKRIRRLIRDFCSHLAYRSTFKARKGQSTMKPARYSVSKGRSLWGVAVAAIVLHILLPPAPAVVVSAWQTAPSLDSIAFRRSAACSSRQDQLVTMYMPGSTPMSQPPSFTAQKMLKVPGVISTASPSRTSTRNEEGSSRSKSMKLSNSVLASCDTLPSFPTAHGLLSPETVMRLDESNAHKTDALRNFLDTYRRKGPLSCLPMLSDPEVLPYLTQAMRDIAA